MAEPQGELRPPESPCSDKKRISIIWAHLHNIPKADHPVKVKVKKPGSEEVQLGVPSKSQLGK